MYAKVASSQCAYKIWLSGFVTKSVASTFVPADFSVYHPLNIAWLLVGTGNVPYGALYVTSKVLFVSSPPWASNITTYLLIAYVAFIVVLFFICCIFVYSTFVSKPDSLWLFYKSHIIFRIFYQYKSF